MTPPISQQFIRIRKLVMMGSKAAESIGYNGSVNLFKIKLYTYSNSDIYKPYRVLSINERRIR